MYAVMGVTERVGAVVARLLLAAGRDVRAIVPSKDNAEDWSREGCDVAVADVRNSEALYDAFAETDGVFVALPQFFLNSPLELRKQQVGIDALQSALARSQLKKVVVLSTMGAHVDHPGRLRSLRHLEQRMVGLRCPVAFLRAAWFLENTRNDVESARTCGVIPSFLQPLDRKVPMVAAADAGRVAASLLQQSWFGKRVVELEGSRRVSPNDVAEIFERYLGTPVRMEPIARDLWHDVLLSSGEADPQSRIEMFDGMNLGLIAFEASELETTKGRVPPEVVIRELVSST